MSHLSLSIILIVYNEEKNIERCLKSVSWADEIIVVDSFSQDKTVELCKKYTSRIFLREFTNYADQKNYALSCAGGTWVLAVDADEEVTKSLKEEILKTVKGASEHNGYRIPRRSFIFGREFRYSGTQDDKPIRLFRRNKGKYVQPIHEVVEIEGNIGVLKNFLRHYTYENISDYLVRFNRYTSLEAKFLKEKKYRSTVGDLILLPFGMFLKLFFLKQGFRDGFEGFLFSSLSAVYVLIKYAKYQEMFETS